MEFWTLGTSSPTQAAGAAQRAEEAGWDGMLVVDSQNLSGDSYVALTSMALATTKIGLGTGVTNPVTRHPAVTASAIASLQRISGGRMVLGIGRGDSALAHLGKAPAGVGTFARYLEVLQAYLRGEDVPFERLGFAEQMAPDVATLGLHDTPDASRLRWLNERDTKVPVEVASTGPRVIEAAARHSERVMLALGADPARVSWGVEAAQAAARKAGRSIRLGAFVNLACHQDVEVARKLVQGGLTTFARFSVMHGEVRGTVSDSQKQVLAALHDEYDMNQHTRADSRQAGVLTPEFIDEYAIVGPPGHCIDRIRALAQLGIDKLTVIGPTAGVGAQAAREAGQLLVTEVLPAFRGA
ncbi:MAG: LLM class flavin-dependent oxidoreductase [Pseudomonadales bacterium]|nr:LLM class flavin-dependent oxidoreductase [Pseudomonadales bacterium]